MSKVEQIIIQALKKSVETLYKDYASQVLSDIYLEVPKEEDFGDFSTNVAMRLAKFLKKTPYETAGAIIDFLQNSSFKSNLDKIVKDIKIEGPGFINFYLSNKAITDTLREILAQGDDFGRMTKGKGKKLQIEFVSANPTGPLTVAHGRQAAIGDSLANILEFCGYKVVREYYINDEGLQMELLGRSVKARYMELLGMDSEFPADGYKGQYIYDIAKDIKDRYGTKAIGKSETFFSNFSARKIMVWIKKDLKDFGVRFDVWYSQKKLSKSGKIKKVLDSLKEKGFLYEKDGAIWFRSTMFGDDKDRVVVKNDNTYTYLAPDIAYHKEKFENGYDKIINIWGPDHHGYINRIKAACQAMGFDKDRLHILIAQLVSLYRDKRPVRMSTREGEFVTLRQILDEVGKDAGRFFFLLRKTDSHLDFDLQLAKSRSMDNPVYYIQYAYARISSVIRFSKSLRPDNKNLEVLDKPQELRIIKRLMQYPKVIDAASIHLEPYILLDYLHELAGIFHSYYDSYRIVTDDRLLTGARLSLVVALKAVFFSGLTLLGVSAPEKM